MQTDVKVFTPELLSDIFPGLTVHVPKRQKHDFDIRYNINVPKIDSDQLVALTKVHKETNVDISIYRYGKGLTIKIAPKYPGASIK